MGGEKLSSATVFFISAGSPPRRRGKGLQVGQQVIDVGITPAWAGKSSRSRSCGSACRSGRAMPGISAMVSSPVDDGHQAKAIGLAPANALAQQGLEGLRVRHL